MFKKTLPVSEIFGPTLQGEGPDIGRACIFLRLYVCHVQCPGCYTLYAWGHQVPKMAMTPTNIQKRLANLRGQKFKLGLVLSGGEPLMYYQEPLLRDLLTDLGDWHWTGLETSGCVGHDADHLVLSWFIQLFSSVVLSPKITPSLHGQGDDQKLDCLIPIFQEALGPDRLAFKFVVRNQADIDAVLRSNDRHQFLNTYRTYLMPFGNNRDEILKSIETLIPHAAHWGFIITPRLHSLIWGAKRGV